MVYLAPPIRLPHPNTDDYLYLDAVTGLEVQDGIY